MVSRLAVVLLTGSQKNMIKKKMHQMEGDRGRERGGGGGRERQGENSNWKTLFSKDCSLGAFRPV